MILTTAPLAVRCGGGTPFIWSVERRFAIDRCGHPGTHGLGIFKVS